MPMAWLLHLSSAVLVRYGSSDTVANMNDLQFIVVVQFRLSFGDRDFRLGRGVREGS
jgi:hypothetical protein